ncbi:RTA1 domain-containing protein [Diplogelasinospora grovesii]|uniref:RTA1 domain-containing protein n=1 Tax=Diplogelasinospora grovesii TaxID=303347 RepID=A0AAN6MYD7_9PEZI|nr:RTA1 domain-containing protein [Diplogelasinospora grovesii]
MASSTSTPTSTTTSLPSSTTSGASPSCTTAVPGEYGHVPLDACNSYYNFDPSYAGNLAFAILFGMTSFAHLVQAILYRKKYCWVLIMGAVWECIAFIMRTLGAHDQQQMQYVIWGTLLVLLAPLWINAFAYMTVARLIHFVMPDERVWGIKSQALTKVFVGLDILTFLIQAAGGSLMSNNGDPGSANLISIGQKVYMAGVGAQGLFIIVFGGLIWTFYTKLHQSMDRPVKRVKMLIWVLFVVLVLIVIRIIFRLIEFSGGVSASNAIISSENYSFFLDGLPMLLALVLLNAMHPGIVLRGPDSEFPKMTGREKKELKRAEKEAKATERLERKARKAGVHSQEVAEDSNSVELLTHPESRWTQHRDDVV